MKKFIASNRKLKKTFQLICVLLISLTSFSQTSTFDWAKQIVGSGMSLDPHDITVDNSGNVYLTGRFKNTVDFDPSSGVNNLTALGTDYSAYVVKLDALGNFVWAKKLGGTTLFTSGQAISVDPSSGNICLTGYFRGTSDFDPSAGVFNLTATGISMFVLQLNSAGNLIWVKQFNGGFGYSRDISIDQSGNIYTTGYYSGTVDFDPNAGVFSLTSTVNSISGSNTNDVYVSKLNSSGNFVWAKKIDGEYEDYCFSITVEPSGNSIYFTGTFEGVVDFDPNAGISTVSSLALVTPQDTDGDGIDDKFYSQDIFVSKLDASGNLVWAKKFSGGNEFDYPTGIVADASGNVYSVGMIYNGTTDFDPNAGVSNLIIPPVPSGKADVYISKLNASGNIVWAKQFVGASGSETVRGLAIDATANLYLTGNMTSNPVDFDPSAGTYIITPPIAVNPAYVVKLDMNGTLLCAETFSATSGLGGPLVEGNALALDATNKVHTFGYFSKTIDFDPTTSIFNLTAVTANSNVFVQKMNLCPPIPLSIDLIYFDGNPENKFNKLFWQTQSENNNDYFTLERSINGTMWEVVGVVDGAGNSTQTLDYQLPDYDYEYSIVYYRLKQTDFNQNSSYSQTIAISRNEIELADIFPNPSENGEIEINIISKVSSDLSVIINDQFGKKIIEKFFHIESGINSFKINTENLSSSVYHIHAETKSGLQTSVKQIIIK